MFKVFKYSFFDLIRSRWTLIYMAFFLLVTIGLLQLSGDSSKVIISLMNVVLFVVPLMATLLGTMYYYNSREFIELLLAQPIPRTRIILGQYLGLTLSLSLSLILGIGLPFLSYGIFRSGDFGSLLILITTGVLLSFTFAAIAFWISLKNENRIKGFGLSVLVWLFAAIMYDGIFLMLLSYFRDYPLDNLAIGGALLNPIDLSRILILLQLDISALMGYTGAVFDKFLGSFWGMTLAGTAALLWILIPGGMMVKTVNHKDF